MAWSWLERKKQNGGDWSGFLDQGVQFEGKLEAPGTFRIDSALKGTVISRDTLILGENAFVEGEIAGNCVLIAGRFAGTIRARGRVEVQASAVVTGDIETPCLLIEPGGVFDGQCQILTAAEQRPIVIPIRSSSMAANPAQ